MVTGYFGSWARSYVVRFQSEEGLDAVGSVGPLTRSKIAQCCAAPVTEVMPPGSGNTSSPSVPAQIKTHISGLFNAYDHQY